MDRETISLSDRETISLRDRTAILDYWYPSPGFQKFWFSGKRNQAVDDEIKERFGKYIEPAFKGELMWTDTLEGILALIIILDQFTRNIYRGGDTSKYDEIALKYAEEYLSEIKKQGYNPTTEHIIFVIMPYRHSVKREDRKFIVVYITFYEETYPITNQALWDKFKSTTLRKIDDGIIK